MLSDYKIHSYEGKENRMHFKDIYYKFIKRVFREQFSDFEISKYLKTKIKNQWLEKHKKIKEIPKTGFKAHQGFASKIILKYATMHRKDKTIDDSDEKEKEDLRKREKNLKLAPPKLGIQIKRHKNTAL